MIPPAVIPDHVYRAPRSLDGGTGGLPHAECRVCGYGPSARHIQDTPESAMADGRCSFDENGGDTLGQYLDYQACGRPAIATWYARQWPGRTRTAMSTLCERHDGHASVAAERARYIIGGRMYEREGIA